MQVNLKPCPYRLVDNEGHIRCNQIKSGEREVSPALCRVCPIAQIDCTHLRATLDHQSRPPITVRWGNGKTKVWDDPAPPLALERAACSAKTIPILSPRDCAGCALRQALVAAEAIPVMPIVSTEDRRRTIKRIPYMAPTPPFSPSPHSGAIEVEARTNVVAQKIIQLQEWLTKQTNGKKDEEKEAGVMPIAVGARSVRAVGEEKRVGWTD